MMNRKAVEIVKMFSVLVLGIAALWQLDRAEAEEQSSATELHRWSFDAATIKLGYTVNTPDNHFFVGVLPDVLKGETDVTIKVFDHAEFEDRRTYQVNAATVPQHPPRLSVDWPLPEGKRIISPVYEFDIDGAADLYNPEKPLWLRVHFSATTNDNKGVYYWDKGKQSWVLIPTVVDEHDHSLRSAIHLTYAPMAILADEIPLEGIASWYAYQDCRCAASRHFQHGTLLTVTDIDSGASTIIEVNDYGPEEWTGRIIDLDVVAFEEISNKRKGLTNVRIEPYLPTQEQIENHDLPNTIDPNHPL